MKRRMIMLLATIILVVGMVAVNSFAYSTTGTESIGSVTNSSGVSKTAWGKLYNSGGVAELQIRYASGSGVCATGQYPANPQNPNDTTCSCPAGDTRTFYVVRVSGSQVWGTSEIGLK